MKLLSSRTQLKNLINKFSIRGFNYKSNQNLIPSKQADLQTTVATQIYNYHKSKQFKQIESGVTPKGIAQQICDIFDHMRDQYSIEVDQFGVIQISYKNTFLQNCMNKIIKNQKYQLIYSDAFQKNELTQKKQTVGIIYPTCDILQPFTINTFRKWNTLESLARINEMLNNDVTRIQGISNNTPFHGIILSYISQKGVNKKLNMNQLAHFLKQKDLKDQTDIVNYGTLMLSQISLDQNLNKINQDMYRSFSSKIDSLFQLKSNYQYISSQKLKVCTLDQILIKLNKSFLKTDYNYFTCQTHQSMKYNHLINKQNLNLRMIQVGAIQNDQQILVILKQLNSMIKERIKNNLPEFDAEIQTGLENRWLRYYLNKFDRKKILKLNNQEIINLIFIKGEQRKDYFLKEAKLQKEQFKIKSRIDRQIAVAVLEIGYLYESNDLLGVHQNMTKIQKLIKRSFNYPNVSLFRILLDQLYYITGIL